MAFGILCKHCGWQETDHTEGPDDKDIAEGRTHPLADCPGYHPEDEAEHKRLREEKENEEILQIERGFGGLPL